MSICAKWKKNSLYAGVFCLLMFCWQDWNNRVREMAEVCIKRPVELSADLDKLMLSEVRSSSTDSGYVNVHVYPIAKSLNRGDFLQNFFSFCKPVCKIKYRVTYRVGQIKRATHLS